MTIDIHTFGKTVAGKHLVQILEQLDDKKTLRLAGTLYSRFAKLAKEMKNIDDLTSFETLYTLCIHIVEKSVNETVLPVDVKTHLISAAQALFRNYYRERVSMKRFTDYFFRDLT
jgi:hypothetical protein